MAVFKCKMCGGQLEIAEGMTVCECEYCGTQQTLPKSDNEQALNMINRANHFRQQCEFDKAAEVYEKLIAQNDSDAELYWSLALCRYGIEYVDDPLTHKKIATCHRTQFKSILDDADYLAAIERADFMQKPVYEAEAKYIDTIQKGILEISNKEEPFDVFICYKETDNNGRRTPDSVLAQDLYYQLKQEGFKVFFSRITLEDKLGTQYEPYIFAALNSAKVMVVVGTKPEYFNAVWVRNEWSRYLMLMQEDRSRTLIPAYKDMDPYDLPDALSMFQAQDMSKLGFMQDLIRGIRKIVKADEPKTTVVKETVVSGGNTNTAPLLKRAFMFLEDGNWGEADSYCEKVLDLDPENASAYLGKLMATLRVKKQEALKDCDEPFDNDVNFQKAIRFATEGLKNELNGYIEHINTRNENSRLSGIYSRAKNAMSAASTESAYKEAARLFESISEYLDSATHATECYDKAEIARKDAILAEGKAKMTGDLVSNYESAIKLFEQISGWKDADEKAYACQRKIEEIKAKQEADRKEAEKRAKRNKRIAIVCSVVVVLGVVGGVITNNVLKSNKYNNAIELYEQGKYEEAIAEFEELGDYKDSATQIENCKYNDAVALMEAGKYNEAIAAFEALNGYKDSATQINKCNTAIEDGKYNDAVALMDSDVIKAYEQLIALDGYKDSAEKANSIYVKYKVEKLKVANVGDYMYFGTYEQDNNTSNGKEDVEWLVLDKQDGKVLVISKYALDCQQYKKSDTDVTWETCSLRRWLNNTFINNAFSSEEQALIPTVMVSADKNPEYSTDPGKATQDKVFLLSITEVNKYFDRDAARMCGTTKYAKAQGAETIDGYSAGGKATCRWWLRSPGSRQKNAVFVNYNGLVLGSGDYVDYDRYAVRPALWITLDS